MAFDDVRRGKMGEVVSLEPFQGVRRAEPSGEGVGTMLFIVLNARSGFDVTGDHLHGPSLR